MLLKPTAIAGWLAIYVVMALTPLGLAMILERPEPRRLLVETGAMLGLLGLGTLAAQLMITGRFRWFAGRVGQDNLLQFHRRVGVLAWFLLLSHPVLLVLGDRGFLAWLDPREDVLRALGIWLLVIALTLLIISSLWRVQLGLQYEYWRILHAVLAFLVVAGGLGHALMAGHHTGGWPTAGLIALAVILPLLLLLDMRLLRPRRLARRPWRVVEVDLRRAESVQLVLEAEGHDGLSFQAGQFAWLTLGDNPYSLQQHPFSMASSPVFPRRLQFVIKQLGDFTGSLTDVAVGTVAFVEGPYGVFYQSSDRDRRTVFVVGGIGITPVLSILRARRDWQYRQPVWLIYANQSDDEIVMREELTALHEVLPMTLVHVIAEPGPEWQGEAGHVDDELLQRYLPDDAPDIDYFVCGPPPLMDVVGLALRGRGVDLLRLHSERFDLV